MEIVENFSEKVEEHGIPDKDSIILLLLTFGLGIFANVLFYGKTPGISVPLFVLVFYLIFLKTIHAQVHFSFSFGWLLTLPIVLLASSFSIFSNEVLQGLNLLVVPILIIAQTTLVAGQNQHEWYSPKFIFDLVFGLFARTWMRMEKPLKLIKRYIQPKTRTGRFAIAGKLVLGLLLSLPLLLIILLLLSSADQVFGNLMGEIPKWFEQISADELIARTILVIMVSIVAFSYIMSLISGNRGLADTTAANGKRDNRIWDSVIVVTILFLVNIIYILFDVIQFTYLFAGFDLRLPAALTYAEYARRGFFELLLVTLINLTLLLCCMNLTKLTSRVMDTCLKMLHTLLILCTFVMLVSAHLRMSLYEEVYGYTYLRVLTHGFMAFIFALLLAALLKIWIGKIPLVRVYIVTALTAYILVNYMNLDQIIAKNNLERFDKTGEIDVAYMESLSWDAIPTMTKLLKAKDITVAEEIKQYLAEKKSQLSEGQPWQSWNASRYLAKNALAGYKLP